METILEKKKIDEIKTIDIELVDTENTKSEVIETKTEIEKPADNKVGVVGEPKKDITDIDDIFEFDFSKSGIKSIREIKKEKYNSKAKLDPKTRHTKNKYFKVYEEYVTNCMTEKQLAEKFKTSIYHISRMIKWVTLEIGDPDPDAQLRVTIDKLLIRQQEMNTVYKTANNVDEKAKIWKALLQVDRLLSQLQSLLNTALIDMSDKRNQVVVNMNENFQRRIGSGKKPEDVDKQIEGREIKQISPVNNVEHRTGLEEK